MGNVAGRVVAVIPARMGSTRLPGKPLARFGGDAMVVHVARRVAAARVDEVLVATDDGRIAEAVRAAGFEAVMTGEHRSGTDRVAEAVAGRRGLALVINVQGDEPLLPPENVDALIAGMAAAPGVEIGTLSRPLPAEARDDPNAVKVVLRRDGRALYFSRSLVPYPRRAEAAAALWRLHLGIYAFRPEALERFVALPEGALERAEGLEQLRALEHGMEIAVWEAPRDSWGVDTPEDLERAAAILAAAGKES